MYRELLELLDEVYRGRVTPRDVLAECLRLLIIQRDEKKARLDSLLGALRRSADDTLPPSSEMIIELIRQHLSMKRASRLPVLVVAAAYRAAEARLRERMLPLNWHNAADAQTKALGDVEICLADDERVVTVYEVKDKVVTQTDIDIALSKIARAEHRIHNYIFVTTAPVDGHLAAHASRLYEQTGGTEIVILDCIGFLRHFLHFFHRSRLDFLNAYQELVIDEPESAVNHTLKEALLVLRATSKWQMRKADS